MAYLTEKERKEPFVHYGGYFDFSCKHQDLSEDIIVTKTELNKKYLSENPKRFQEELVKETARFICGWTIQVHRKLNGFSGTDCFKWNFDF